MTEVVGVHGIAQQQRGRKQLLSEWAPALEDGVEIAGGRDVVFPGFDLAFYGDVFLSGGAEGHRDDDGQGTSKGAAIVSGENDAEALADISGDELAFLEEAAGDAIADRPDLGEPMGVRPVPAALRPLTRQLTRHFDGRAVLGFVSALRQVRLYQVDDQLAAGIRNRVLGRLTDNTRVLLSHSLGTVVAFETLTLNPDVSIDILVTLGSPLGMAAVCSRLRKPAGAPPGGPRLPPNVRRWVNIYDPGDPVAAAGSVSRLWPGAEDYDVDNEDSPHEVSRYLSKRITGQTILDGLING